MYSEKAKYSILHQQRCACAAFCAQVHLLRLIVSREGECNVINKFNIPCAMGKL
jgi:hypothetical protein